MFVDVQRVSVISSYKTLSLPFPSKYFISIFTGGICGLMRFKQNMQFSIHICSIHFVTGQFSQTRQTTIFVTNDPHPVPMLWVIKLHSYVLWRHQGEEVGSYYLKSVFFRVHSKIRTLVLFICQNVVRLSHEIILDRWWWSHSHNVILRPHWCCNFNVLEAYLYSRCTLELVNQIKNELYFYLGHAKTIILNSKLHWKSLKSLLLVTVTP